MGAAQKEGESDEDSCSLWREGKRRSGGGALGVGRSVGPTSPEPQQKDRGEKAFASLSSLDASPGPVLPPLPRGGGLQTEGKSRAPRYTVLQWTIKQ